MVFTFYFIFCSFCSQFDKIFVMKGRNVTLPAPMTLHDGKVLGVKEDSMQTDTMLLLVSKVFQMKSCNGKTYEFLVGLGQFEIATLIKIAYQRTYIQ